MNGQRSALTESFAAFGALERLLLAVYISMISEVILPAESFAANVAGVRSLVRVRAFVYQ